MLLIRSLLFLPSPLCLLFEPLSIPFRSPRRPLVSFRSLLTFSSSIPRSCETFVICKDHCWIAKLRNCCYHRYLCRLLHLWCSDFAFLRRCRKWRWENLKWDKRTHPTSFVLFIERMIYFVLYIKMYVVFVDVRLLSIANASPLVVGIYCVKTGRELGKAWNWKLRLRDV